MKFENTKVFNFEGAIRGMRNPMNSWHLSDTYCGYEYNDGENIQCRIPDGQDYAIVNIDNEIMEFVSIGPKDMDLAHRLIHGGSEHRKFMRQITVCVDITAPLYWWKEFDTYKVGTTANSTSTMHKIQAKPITRECFEMDDFEDIIHYTYDADKPVDYVMSDFVDSLCENLELLRQKYLITKDKAYWKELIRWLPEGWLQTRTITMNYENLYAMVRQRNHHKLTEWHSFINWVHTLPYSRELIFCEPPSEDDE